MNELKKYLSKKLKEELPGKKAHTEAAPYRKIDYDSLDLNTVKRSAVLVLFYQKENKPHLVLIQRPVYDGTHSGQVGFPGGKVEEYDRDIIDTALREANEEVGVIVEDVEVIGQLSDVYIPVSNFLVTPVVGFINYAPEFIAEVAEVAEIIELELLLLTDTKELSSNHVKLGNGLKLQVPTFEFNRKTVWGATALMLNELRWVLRTKI